jgi:hypothetical protein
LPGTRTGALAANWHDVATEPSSNVVRLDGRIAA